LKFDDRFNVRVLGKSLDDLVNVLCKYYLIRKESAYQEIPSGFVEITANSNLYKDDDDGAYYCCRLDKPDNEVKVLGKCCLNFSNPERDYDPNCFRQFERVFRNFRPSKK